MGVFINRVVCSPVVPLVQAEKELKDDLEVKLAVSSLVCAVSDKASTERLNQRASEELKLEKKRIMRATTNEGKLKAELGKTNATVSSLQSDLGAATAWRRGVDELESKLMARIEELKATAEVRKNTTKSTTALPIQRLRSSHRIWLFFVSDERKRYVDMAAVKKHRGQYQIAVYSYTVV